MNDENTGAGNADCAARILDLGCGMSPHKKANIVMDINPMIRKLPENIEKHVYDLNKLPYPFDDCSIDEIRCTQVLEHLTIHTFQFLAECYRILKPNGILYLVLPNAFYITARLRFLLGNYANDTSFHPFHGKLLKPSYVKQHLRYLGFSTYFMKNPKYRYRTFLKSLFPDLFSRGIDVVARKRP